MRRLWSGKCSKCCQACKGSMHNSVIAKMSYESGISIPSCKEFSNFSIRIILLISHSLLSHRNHHAPVFGFRSVLPLIAGCGNTETQLWNSSDLLLGWLRITGENYLCNGTCGEGFTRRESEPCWQSCFANGAGKRLSYLK